MARTKRPSAIGEEERTYEATVTGTVGYMPPEQLGGTLDHTCDTYSLGATLIHLLTRLPPWELNRNGGQPSLDERLNVSSHFRSFLKRLVARTPAERFASASEALRFLNSPPIVPATVVSPYASVHGNPAVEPSIRRMLFGPMAGALFTAICFALPPSSTFTSSLALAGLALPFIWAARTWKTDSFINRYGGGCLTSIVSMMVGSVVGYLIRTLFTFWGH